MDAPKPTPRAGARVLQTKVILNGIYGADSVIETAVGGKTDWVNPANATGKKNSSFATLVGSATTSKGGRLDLSYADFVTKSHLSITSVFLHFYAKMTGAPLLGLGTPISFQWSKGGTITTLTTAKTNFDSSVVPIAIDISAGITAWADLDAVKTYVSASTAALETPTISLDAVHLLVNANHTEVL